MAQIAVASTARGTVSVISTEDGGTLCAVELQCSEADRLGAALLCLAGRIRRCQQSHRQAGAADKPAVGDGSGETATRLEWAGPGDNVVLKLRGPSRATLRDFYINAGGAGHAFVWKPVSANGTTGTFIDRALHAHRETPGQAASRRRSARTPC